MQSSPRVYSLGPLLYVTHASELQVMVAERHVRFHGFADDSQLSKSVRVEDAGLAKQVITDCVLDIQRWSSSHRLKLNASKSEIIWLGTSRLSSTRPIKCSYCLTAHSNRQQWSRTWVSTLMRFYQWTITRDIVRGHAFSICVG